MYKNYLLKILQPYRCYLWPLYIGLVRIYLTVLELFQFCLRKLRHYPRTKSKFKNCWLISDRDISADDNGEHFYRYVQRNFPEISIYFLLKQDSFDWERLKASSFNLIPFGSEEHREALDNCALIISSQADNYVINYFGEHSDWKKKFVFLQHGVTKDDLSAWLNFKNISLFVTSTYEEWKSIVSPQSHYRFDDKVVKLLGMPRHDKLLTMNQPEKLILIAPTWRKYLSAKEMGRGEFLRSEYSMRWSEFIKSQELHDLTQKYGYKVVFLPHPNMRQYLEYMEIPDYIPVFGLKQESIQDVIAQASILITDYSSLAFEMALLCKSVIYYQFDVNSFYTPGMHTYRKGYFSYVDNGFGEVVNKPRELIELLKCYLRNSCKPPEKYFLRMQKCFQYRDGRNCERVFNSVRELSINKKRGIS